MALDARDGLTSGCNSTEGETPTMRLTAIAHHLMPFAALAGGILVLLMPRLLNYVVAIYLILVGFIAQQPFSLLPLTGLRRAWRWMRATG